MKLRVFAVLAVIGLSSPLAGCANPSACMGSSCVNITNAEPAKLTADEAGKVERGELVKIQQWATNNGTTYPPETPDNHLEMLSKGASKLSWRDYPNGVSVCVHSGLVCQPSLSTYVGTTLSKRYGFKIAKDAASSDAIFYIDAGIFNGMYYPDLANSIEYGLSALKMTLGENNDALDISGLPLSHVPRENARKIVTLNLVEVATHTAQPFAGVGMVKRGAGALWYKPGSKNPRFSLSGVCDNKVLAHDAAFKMFLQVLDELLIRSIEPVTSK